MPAPRRVQTATDARAAATPDTVTVWLVDAFNVLGSRPDGWWRDREAALAALVDQIAAWSSPPDVVLVVVDGHPGDRVPEGPYRGIVIRYAHSSAPDAADDVVVAEAEAADAPGMVVVVTSDARLRGRVAAHGAAVEGAARFRRRLERVS